MKKYKSLTKIINLKYKLRHGMKNLNYVMYQIMCPIFKIILTISLKDTEKRLQ